MTPTEDFKQYKLIPIQCIGFKRIKFYMYINNDIFKRLNYQKR